MAAGTYSSIFIATPLLVDLKNRQPEITALQARVLARRKSGRAFASAGSAVSGESGDGVEDSDAGADADSTALPTTRVATGPRQQPRRKPRSRR
jgi:preprotein translocase subunit SecF